MKIIEFTSNYYIAVVLTKVFDWLFLEVIFALSAARLSLRDTTEKSYTDNLFLHLLIYIQFKIHLQTLHFVLRLRTITVLS